MLQLCSFSVAVTFFSMMVFFFFLIHVHECLFLFTDRGRLLPGQAIKGKSKRWDCLITDCCCTKSWQVFSANTVFGIYNHANMRCFYLYKTSCFSLCKFWWLLDGTRLPRLPLKNLKALAPATPSTSSSGDGHTRRTSTLIWRNLGEFSTAHLWPPAFILLGWFKSHYRLHGSNCPHCR